MLSKTVRTKKELKKAYDDNVKKIIVVGKLATDLQKTKKLGKLSKAKVAALVATLGLSKISAPVTGGLSYAALVPAAAITGTEVATIILALGMGLSLVLAIHKDYEVVQAKAVPPEIIIKKKKDL